MPTLNYYYTPVATSLPMLHAKSSACKRQRRELSPREGGDVVSEIASPSTPNLTSTQPLLLLTMKAFEEQPFFGETFSVAFRRVTCIVRGRKVDNCFVRSEESVGDSLSLLLEVLM